MQSVGVLIPSTNTVMEQDLHRYLDPPFRVHTARMHLADVTADSEQRMLDEEALPAARRIAAARPDVVVFGCTSAASLHDAEYDEAFRTSLEQATHAPVVGVLPSIIRELIGAQGVALFTPYVEELTTRIASSLRAAGVPLTSVKGLGIQDNSEIGALEPDEIVEAVLSMDLHGSDRILCSCTNLRAWEAREPLTGTTGLPVVTSNQAVAAQVGNALRPGQRLAPVSASPAV